MEEQKCNAEIKKKTYIDSTTLVFLQEKPRETPTHQARPWLLDATLLICRHY